MPHLAYSHLPVYAPSPRFFVSFGDAVESR